MSKIIKYRWLISIIFLYISFKLLMYFTGRVFFDEGVYVAMAKYFASSGSAGYFEYIRPLLLPLMLSPLQLIPFDPLVSGRLLMMALTVGCILLVYYIAKSHFGDRAALWASLLFAMSGSVMFFGGTILNDVLVSVLILFSASLAWRRKYFISGCIAGMAFLLKFPALIIIVPISIFIIYRYRRRFLYPLILFGAGAAVLAMPYIIFNLLYYDGTLMHRIMFPLADASGLLQNDTWLYQRASLWGYLLFMLIIELPLLISMFFAGSRSQRKEREMMLFFSFCALFFLMYFSFFVHRLDYRYMLSIIPFLAIMGGLGLSRIKRRTKIMAAFVIASPLIMVSVFLLMGHAANDIFIPSSEKLVVTNSGQALLQVEGKSSLYPGPNMGYMYMQWKLDDSSDVLLIDLDGYPCQKNDSFCKEEKRLHISRIISASRPVACGKSYGEDAIILSKSDEGQLSFEQCSRSLRGGPYERIDSKAFIRLHAAVLTQEGKLQNLENLESVVNLLHTKNISSTLVIVPSEYTMGSETKEFFKNLPSNIDIGILPKDGIDTDKFMRDFSGQTAKKITVIASPSDDWIKREQDFPAAISSCIRGSWDQTVMVIPCRQIDLFTMKDWQNGKLYNEDYLVESYDALSEADYEVGVDIPVQALDYSQTSTVLSFLEKISGE